MPHFIIDCSEDIINLRTPGEIMQAVYDAAESTGLFAENDIKVRIDPYRHYKLGRGKRISSIFLGILWKAGPLSKGQIFPGK